ncbi:DUF4167 domain-containing protein [Bartonella ancashensis]|uniref:Mll3431-like protein n=1 Tax=Bartonella ancashensis TaxID=1318743 RepID=A0A0M3T2N7_9HYPH|nr:DUF4167 domain-containing protein [Bartonella ancashensis]ALE03055.1 Mll3431-like protein [Bartonella ancashensis]
MRSQQNKRVRGRNNNSNNNNNNRRHTNPLSRNYESNGPDVKVRGNAQQIADKYINLAYDAQGAGDRIMAENYLQHAEHYLRIILAANGQMSQQAKHRDERSDQECTDEGVDDFQKEEVSNEPAPATTNATNNAQPRKRNDRRKGKEKLIQEGSVQNEEKVVVQGNEDEAVRSKEKLIESDGEQVQNAHRPLRRRSVSVKEISKAGAEEAALEMVHKKDELVEKSAPVLALKEEVKAKTRSRRRQSVSSSLEEKA